MDVRLQQCFIWWLLFQKPDQIEVGEDGFKQWDGKTSPKSASPLRLDIVKPLIESTRLDRSKTITPYSTILVSSLLMYHSCFCNVVLQWSQLWTWRPWPTPSKAGWRIQWSLPVRTVSRRRRRLPQMWPAPMSRSTFWLWRASYSTMTRKYQWEVAPFGRGMRAWLRSLNKSPCMQHAAVWSHGTFYVHHSFQWQTLPRFIKWVADWIKTSCCRIVQVTHLNWKTSFVCSGVIAVFRCALMVVMGNYCNF